MRFSSSIRRSELAVGISLSEYASSRLAYKNAWHDEDTSFTSNEIVL